MNHRTLGGGMKASVWQIPNAHLFIEKKYLILYCSTSWISNTSDLVLE